MPMDLGRKQTIEELTNGRIKKKALEEERGTGRPARGGRASEERPARKRTAR